MRFLRLPLGLAVLTAAMLSAACGGSGATPARPAATSTSAVDPATAGRLSGRVRFEGEAPAAEMVRIDADKTCVTLNGSDQQPADAIVLGDGNALQNVFVYVKSGLEKATFPIPSAPVVVDQQKCRYVPRVVGVRVGQPIEIRNSDPLLHNVRSDSGINQPFNQGQPVQGMVFSHTFTTREVMVPVKCDVHNWMRAYVGALEHPYFAVTGEAGTFALPDLPPGTYTIEAWHERLGTREQQVTIGAKESKDVEFTFAR
jgi:plastocyanin